MREWLDAEGLDVRRSFSWAKEALRVMRLSCQLFIKLCSLMSTHGVSADRFVNIGRDLVPPLPGASDRIQHDAMWRILRNHSISEQYISLLKKLHADQRTTVLTDVESDEFRIVRGTKTRLSLEKSCFQVGSSIRNGETH